MRTSNEVYREVKIGWGDITFPLKAGTPVSLAGAISNDGDAIGLIPTDYFEEPTFKSIYVLVGGDVILSEVEESFGDSLEDAAKSNMNGIRFWLDDGTVYNATELPSVTAEDDGDVLTVVDGAWAKATPTKELPSVTAGDDGDVLTVVEGAWAKATPSGGAFVIGMTSEMDVDALDKTWKEIHDAMASGQIAIILSEENADTVIQDSIARVTKSSGVKPYQVKWVSDGDSVVFYATTENDYPSSDDGYGGDL